MLGLTAFNVVQVMRLTSRDAEVRTRADADEAEAARLRSEARVIRQTINRDQLAAVQTAAREANQLIDRRAFSWTDLFNRFEATLPGDVRIASVTPQLDPQGRMLVAVTVISRRVEELDGFIEALEKTGAFQEVLSRQEEAQEDGTLKSVIQGYYRPSAGGGVAGDGPAGRGHRGRGVRVASASRGEPMKALFGMAEAVPLSRVVSDYRLWIIALVVGLAVKRRRADASWCCRSPPARMRRRQERRGRLRPLQDARADLKAAEQTRDGSAAGRPGPRLVLPRDPARRCRRGTAPDASQAESDGPRA